MTIFHKILFVLVLAFGIIHTSLAEHPFTDVPRSSPYFDAVNALYNNGVITNDGTGLFHPDDTMKRDFYVSLVVGVGCKKCTTPSVEDVRKYTLSPYRDLPKINPYYYCIAYADDKDIVRGYVLDNNRQTTCQNGNIHTSVPFCAENTISRIEAAAILLRRAGLWDEKLNAANKERTLQISDVSDYWYGYAKKAIEADLIIHKQDGSIGQDEMISRGEFALMTSKVLSFTQCNPARNENAIESKITINQNGQITEKRKFDTNESCTLTPITSQSKKWKYQWKLIHRNGTKKTFTTNEISCNDIDDGTTDIEVDIIDPKTNTPVSTPSVTINITDTDTDNSDDPTGIGVVLDADPLTGPSDTQFIFTTTLSETPNPTKKHIDYGDGNTEEITDTTIKVTQPHTYDSPRTYTVTVTVTDTKTGETGQSTVVVVVTEDDDLDDDGIPNDNDKCPRVKGPKENNGCPLIDTGDHNCKSRQSYGENVKCNNGDSDGDGTLDENDDCPLVAGPKENNGCPNNIDAEILIYNGKNLITSKTRFHTDEICTLSPHVSKSGNWKYKWSVQHKGGERQIHNQKNISCDLLKDGISNIKLDIIDSRTNKVVASPKTTLSIYDILNTDDLGVLLYANPITQKVNEPFVFTLHVSETKNKTQKKLTFGDATNSGITNENTKITRSHSYSSPGVYQVQAHVVDIVTGNTGSAHISVRVINNDSDGDGIPDEDDDCPNIAGTVENKGCPNPDIPDSKKPISPNICLLNKSKNTGLIQGKAVCTQCPCVSNLNISSLVRECDILFPTILSLDRSTVYSRGSFYLVQ